MFLELFVVGGIETKVAKGGGTGGGRGGEVGAHSSNRASERWVNFKSSRIFVVFNLTSMCTL